VNRRDFVTSATAAATILPLGSTRLFAANPQRGDTLIMDAMGELRTIYDANLLQQMLDSGMARMERDMGYAGALSGSGAAQRDSEQARLDLRLADFYEQQNHPLQQLGVRQSALGMTPMGSIQKTPVQRSGLNFGSLLGGLGSLASGLGGTAGLLCWVAREVYGIDNPRWLIFREWVVTESPRWFFKLYSTHGEAFAQWIADKPRIKHMIRTAMDVVVDRKIREARDVASLA